MTPSLLGPIRLTPCCPPRGGAAGPSEENGVVETESFTNIWPFDELQTTELNRPNGHGSIVSVTPNEGAEFSANCPTAL